MDLLVIEIPRSGVAKASEAPAGTWWRTDRVVETPKGREVTASLINIKCPECLKTSSLQVLAEGGTVVGHAIAQDGTVTPSIVCPHRPCAWHVHGRLLEW
jgi:hypothetical protein